MVRAASLLFAMALLCAMLSGCGKKVEAGAYSGSVSFNHPMEVEVAGFGPNPGGIEQIDQWGANVTITIDEAGVIWDVQAEAPEGTTMALGMWSVFGGKFTGSITGNYSCKQMMGVTVDVENDGFPVLNGDCSGIHQPDGVDMTLLNDNEAACAMIILAIQDAIITNNLA